MIDRSGGVDVVTFARTYEHQSYADMWEIVEQYTEVVRYANDHPNEGSTAISSLLEFPRGRIRSWTDGGGAPDAVRGLRAADKRGWLGADYADPEFAGLNALVTNVFSGGTILARNYVPRFALNARGRDSNVFDALELANVEWRIVDDRDGHGDEVLPSEDGPILGRTLSVLGTPVGQKAQQPGKTERRQRPELETRLGWRPSLPPPRHDTSSGTKRPIAGNRCTFAPEFRFLRARPGAAS